MDYRNHVAYFKVIGRPVEPISESFYPTDQFTEGIILIGDDLVSKPIMMRYNKLNDVVEVKGEPEIYEIRPTSGACEIRLKELTLVSQEFEIKGVTKIGFFEQLTSGNYSLLTKEVYKPSPGTLSEGPTNQPNPKYVWVGRSYLKVPDGSPAGLGFLPEDFKRHFYCLANGRLIEIKRIQKFIDALPRHSDELSRYAKENKLVTNEKDLIQLITYYDSL
ncbi:MAG: hypothetical protein RIE86_25185 [Imperialibacter sp.]|uniref:hypothetical protein n=1 Tax=Imperialibacter sp. TaxID=2038411 RepID=UPI0032F055C7